MRPPLLAPALVGAAMLGGLVLALFGAGAWDFVACLLIAPAPVLAALIAARAARALARSDDAPPPETTTSRKED
ncbi:MAG: hypothetical protein QM608_07540 [Caulobacter sp.]